ncbi:MAG TPA: D-aminoacylase, partial [Acidobacteria bacterium]|nr:D-aminoacylase [Acidobacteriota bacterium]
MVACDALIRRSARLTPCSSIMRIGLRLSCTLLLAVAAPAPLAQEAYDLVIAGGFVVDGTGTPGYRADVAVAGERIVAVGLVDPSRARRVIDAGGLWVTPGFIDPHSHAAGGLASAELSHARPLLAQGITTVFVNPDGGGPVDLVAQRGQLLEHGLGVNVAQLVGHGSIRSTVIGRDDRAPTADELDRMRALAREAMEQGAFGLSSGLFYAPGSYAEIGEVVELGKVVARYGGVYTSHIRDESDYTIGLPAAIDEVIRVAREAGMRGSVTHIKALGPRVWGTAADVIAQIEQARAAGVEVFACQYPYTASATGLSAALLDRWIQEGDREQMLARLRDPEVRRRVRREMVESLDRRGGAERIQFR